MALSQNSKILIDDINTALSGKIDTAGTGLSKSGTTLALASVVTAGNAGPTANATLAYSGTFTVPYITYDAYGRVTGRTNRTMTMPAAPSGGSATMISNCGASSSGSGKLYLPSGGTWAYYTEGGTAQRAGTASGGTHINSAGDGTYYAIYVRIA